MLCAEPVTGSSGTPCAGAKKRETKSRSCSLGAVTIAVWPAFAARRRRATPRPLILSGYGSAAVTAVFVVLLGWLLAETRDGSVLGLAERLTTSIETCWPFIIAVAVRRRPGPELGRAANQKVLTRNPPGGVGSRPGSS